MQNFRNSGHNALVWIQDFGLVIIAIATVIAMGFEIKAMIEIRQVALADLLLLFIYLEVLAMVSIYLDSGKLPVRMPLYIAIVAIARYMILDMKNLDTMRLLGLAGAALVLGITILLIRFGHKQYPYNKHDDT